MRRISAPSALPVVVTTKAAVPRRAYSPAMGLFGLGWGELGVIGIIALFFFGPEKLAPLARDLGERAPPRG